MEPRPLEYIARQCGGELIQGVAGAMVYRVSTDSRQVRSGDLFVALAGARLDGHDYLDQAAERGAGALLVSKEKIPARRVACAVIAAPDSRPALGRLAAGYREDFDLPMVAVGGSNGKTTTKDLLASILGQHFKTLSSEASFNNDIGVPLTLLNLTGEHGAAVLEAGTNHPGELRPLLEMIRPGVSVLTSIGQEHLEFFRDLNGVIAEEASLGEVLPEASSFFLYGDGDWKSAILARVRARPITVGLNPGNDWQASDIQVWGEGTRFTVRAPNRYFSGSYRMNLLGRHQVTNALLALAVAAEFDLDREELQQGLLNCPAPKMRMQLVPVNGLSVLDDSYNANPDSVAAALETLRQLPATGRKIAVLGDMAELGEASEAAHRAMGEKAARAGVELLVVIGSMARIAAAAARERGLAVEEFPDVEAAIAGLEGRFRRGDLILVKASRSSGLERVVRFLRASAPGAGDQTRN